MGSNQASSSIAPVESGRDYVVVDLGGTQIRTAVFDVAGQLLTRRAITTPAHGGPAAVIAAVLAQIQQAIAEHPAAVVAVGVSALGPVDPHTGTIANAPTLPRLRERPARTTPAASPATTGARLQRRQRRHHRRMATRRRPRDQRLLLHHRQHRHRLRHHQQRPVDHRPGRLRRRIRPDPHPAVRWRLAQLEQLSSGTAIATHARALVASGQPTSLAEVAPHEITAGTVAAAARGGDDAALGLFTSAATTLGIQLANLTRLVDPEVIALGGGVAQAGNLFWDPLTTSMSGLPSPRTRSPPRSCSRPNSAAMSACTARPWLSSVSTRPIRPVLKPRTPVQMARQDHWRLAMSARSTSSISSWGANASPSAWWLRLAIRRCSAGRRPGRGRVVGRRR